MKYRFITKNKCEKITWTVYNICFMGLGFVLAAGTVHAWALYIDIMLYFWDCPYYPQACTDSKYKRPPANLHVVPTHMGYPFGIQKLSSMFLSSFTMIIFYMYLGWYFIKTNWKIFGDIKRTWRKKTETTEQSPNFDSGYDSEITEITEPNIVSIPIPIYTHEFSA